MPGIFMPGAGRLSHAHTKQSWHNHRSIAIQKLGARNRMEAARLAEQKDWQ
jgi:DNA-binding CsgD family transcriptional regulator